MINDKLKKAVINNIEMALRFLNDDEDEDIDRWHGALSCLGGARNLIAQSNEYKKLYKQAVTENVIRLGNA